VATKTRKKKTMAPKDQNDSKIMDVAKPSQKKPDNTARPVIVGHTNTMAQDPMMSQAKMATAPEVIKPLEPVSKTGKAVDRPEPTAEETPKKPQVVIIKDANEPEEEPVVAAMPEEPAKAEEPVEVPEPEAPAEEPAEPEAEKPAEEQPTLTEEAETAENSVTTEETPTTDESKAKAEPINAENEKIAKLIATKEYFLPIKKSRSNASGHHHTSFVWFLLLIAILAGAYVAIDAKLVKNDIKLPYHIFKNISSN